MFESKIAHAKRQNAGSQDPIWVETSKSIIDFYNPTGLGKVPYFSYSGVLVCEKGKIEECEALLERSVDHLNHGPSEGKRI